VKAGWYQAPRALLAAAGSLLCFSLIAADARGAAELTRAGTRHLESGEFAMALEQFRAAARLRPGDPALQFNLGLALFRLGRYREALAPLKSSLAHAGSAAQARYLRGTIFFQFDEFESCSRELEPIRASGPEIEHVLYMLVESYRNSRDAERSRGAFVELGTRYPDSAFLHKLMGMAHEWQNNETKAIEEFQQALRVNPRMPEMAFAIGFIYFKQQRYEDARAWFSKELALDPCSAKSHHYLGEMDFAAEKWVQAAARYRKAIECDPDFGDAYVGLGAVLEHEGKLEAAVKLYREAVRLKPRDMRAHYKLGLALRRTGDREEGDAEFAIARKLIQEEESRKKAAPPGRAPE
jgi:tetratricopeptide (TPR) repeat protein